MTQFLLTILWIILIILSIGVTLYFITHLIIKTIIYLLKTTHHQQIKRLVAFIIMPISALLFLYTSTFLTAIISHDGWSVFMISLIAIGLFIIQLIAGGYFIGSYLQNKS